MMIGFLTALQQADSAFPSGSFAFSNGIEGLLALEPELTDKALRSAIAAAIRHRWASADRVALVHAYRAGDDLSAIARVDEALEAATLAEPLRIGSSRNGAALLAAHVRLGTRSARDLRAVLRAARSPGHLPVVQGFLWHKLGLAEQEAVAVSGYTSAAGLISAAVRLGRIGAIEAQAILAAVLVAVSETSQDDVPPPEQIASFSPWLDIAASRQARAPIRLFTN